MQHDQLLGDARLVVFSQGDDAPGSGIHQAGFAGGAAGQGRAPWEQLAERVVRLEDKEALLGGRGLAVSVHECAPRLLMGSLPGCGGELAATPACWLVLGVF